MLANGCLVTDGNHRFDDLDNPVPWQGFTTKGPVSIGDNVWLGANVVVTSGVTIGRRAVIGANSVVTEDVPAVLDRRRRPGPGPQRDPPLTQARPRPRPSPRPRPRPLPVEWSVCGVSGALLRTSSARIGPLNRTQLPIRGRGCPVDNRAGSSTGLRLTPRTARSAVASRMSDLIRVSHGCVAADPRPSTDLSGGARRCSPPAPRGTAVDLRPAAALLHGLWLPDHRLEPPVRSPPASGHTAVPTARGRKSPPGRPGQAASGALARTRS